MESKQMPLLEFVELVVDQLIASLKKWDEQFILYQIVENVAGKHKIRDPEYISLLKKETSKFLLNNELAQSHDGGSYVYTLSLVKGKELFIAGSMHKYISTISERAKRINAQAEMQKSNDLEEKQLRIKSIDKTNQDIEIGKWLLKTKWWPHAIAAISTAASVATFMTAITWHNEDKQQNTEQKQTIQELNLKLSTTKNEILHKVDSLYRIEHKTAISK